MNSRVLAPISEHPVTCLSCRMSEPTPLGPTDVVAFDSLETVRGYRFRIATLNAPETLNALSMEMIDLLAPRLREWATEPDTIGVIIRGSGNRAFSAGGDIRELYYSICQYGSGENPYAGSFFAREYELDHLIHTYPKPVICWGRGIVLGGGVGLMAGASHRVVTPSTKMAMPEIGIGFLPDVGGSWFLRRMPGRAGLFLALTGAPWNAADALYCGMADYHLLDEGYDGLCSVLAAEHWSGRTSDDRATVSRLLAGLASLPTEASRVRTHLDHINSLVAGDDIHEIGERLRSASSEDAWLDSALDGFRLGSPTAAALIFELWQRVPRLGLADVLRLEYWVALGCTARHDFAEGVRALLIDRDRTPHWEPAKLDEVTRDLVIDHFRERVHPHPLAHLREPAGDRPLATTDT
jgi:enoyl-CoA hydratase/carnithine racemase